jgi:hypothetical protein
MNSGVRRAAYLAFESVLITMSGAKEQSEPFFVLSYRVG